MVCAASAPYHTLAMARHPIGRGWCIDLPDEFQRRLQDEQHVFWTPGRTVYAVAYQTDATDAEGALSEMAHDRRTKPVERFERKDGETIGQAWLLPEGDEEHRYWGLNTWTACRGAVACVTFYFEDRADLDWALRAWRTVRPGTAAAAVAVQ